MRFVQLALAVAGMVLALRFGVERTPPWGEANGMPAYWHVHALPLACGLGSIALAMALIWFKDDSA